MAARFSKPKGMTYTDLCIWIDNNFYEPGCDMNKAFEYMYIIAYMLASKKKYFTNIDDYDGYAQYLAFSTYTRMTNADKNQIKSVLNYMKSIMRFRKIGYQKETFSEVIDSEYNKAWNGDLYTEKNINRLENGNRVQLESLVEDLLTQIPKSVHKNIPKVYKSDKFVSKNIYTSVLLTLLYNFTLPKINEDFLKQKEAQSSTFNNVEYYHKHLDNETVLWYLPESMKSVVVLVVNKVKCEILNDIKSVIDDYKMSEQEYKNIFNDIIFGENDNGDENE